MTFSVEVDSPEILFTFFNIFQGVYLKYFENTAEIVIVAFDFFEDYNVTLTLLN